jgi:hypothetical protein
VVIGFPDPTRLRIGYKLPFAAIEGFLKWSVWTHQETYLAIVKGLVRGQQQQQGARKEWERALDCLSLGLCHLFE